MVLAPPPQWQDLTPLPRFITAWPEMNAHGTAICRMQRAMGSRPMPWQVLAAHAIGQRNHRGRPVWNYIIVTVPRQSGKTTAAGSWGTHRAITTPKGKIWYTAQTGQKARDRWLEMAAAVQTSVFGPFVKVLKTNGSEALLFPEIRSQFRPHPPTEESLHSEQSDLNIVDEAWAYDEYQADALMQAIVPTQTTRPMRQTIIISTMGTADSTWFHREVEKARSGDPSIFMIDYGIGPDVDANDLDAVAAACQ